MAAILPEGRQSFTDASGFPLIGGKLYTYDAGTSNPRPTYSDAGGTVPNTNPVILDVRGEATIFWDGSYKVVLKDALDVTIWTQDNVSTRAFELTATSDEFIGDGATPSFVLSKQPGSAANCRVVVEGITLTPGIDYNVSGNVLTFAVPPPKPNPATPTEPNISVVSGTAYASPSDATSIAYTQGGAGASETTVASRLRRMSVSPKDFGGLGDWNGTTGTDDTTAVNAMYVVAKLTGYACDLSNAKYRITAPLLINSNATKFFGSGKNSGLVVTTDIDIIRVDIGGRYAYFNQFENFSLEYVNATAPTTGVCIHYYDSLGTQAGGGTHGIFEKLWMNHKYGIVFDRAHLGTFAPTFPEVADYGHFSFKSNQIPYNAGRTAIGIWFKGGPGAHNQYEGNDFSCATACVQMGGSDEGVGDQTFSGNNHFLDAAYAIDIIGPTTGGRYNQNVTIVGNQFDGITTNTVRMTRMQNFRIGPNNSTSSVGVSLVSCTGNYWSEDRGNIAYSGTFTQLGAINTTISPIITDTNGWRYGSPILGRRTANDQYLKIVGGNVDGAGAGVAVYGGAHATLPNYSIATAAVHQFRSQDGATTFFSVANNNITAQALANYANDAAAAAGGIAVGQWYRNGSVVMQRIV